MSQKTRFSRLIVAGLLAAMLISGAFLGTTPTTVFAEGGATGPMPADTNIPADGCPADPGTGLEDLSTWDLMVIIAQGIL